MTTTNPNTPEGSAGPVVLMACPFCGGEPKHRWHTGPAGWLECDECGAVGPQGEGDDWPQVEGKWNTRSAPAPREPEAAVPERARVDIRGIALAAIKEARQAGESQEMLARWISERVNAALQQAALPPVGDVEAEDAYQLGKRDGYEAAVQEIDEATGGDGEYRYCTDRDPERHCPDAPTMKARIVARFAAPKASPDVEGMIERMRKLAYNHTAPDDGVGRNLYADLADMLATLSRTEGPFADEQDPWRPLTEILGSVEAVNALKEQMYAEGRADGIEAAAKVAERFRNECEGERSMAAWDIQDAIIALTPQQGEQP